MLTVSEYFEGKVKSIAVEGNELPATVGVMSAGEYSFGTDYKEIMSVVCGKLIVQLPDTDKWVEFTDGDVFNVDANKTFKLKVPVDTAYLCKYIK